MEENSMYDKLLLLPLFQGLYQHIGKSKIAFSEIHIGALYRKTRRSLQRFDLYSTRANHV